MSRGKILIAKVGLDGHTTGASVVAQGLMDAGFEVLNLGTRVQPVEAVSAAVQEDVDVIGLSILSGAHMYLTEQVLRLADQAGVDAAVVVGGTIPDSEGRQLREQGAAAVFGPGSSMESILETMDELVAERRRSRDRAKQPAPAGDRT